MNTYFTKAIAMTIGAAIGAFVCYKVAEHIIDSPKKDGDETDKEPDVVYTETEEPVAEDSPKTEKTVVASYLTGGVLGVAACAFGHAIVQTLSTAKNGIPVVYSKDVVFPKEIRSLHNLSSGEYLIAYPVTKELYGSVRRYHETGDKGGLVEYLFSNHLLPM